MCRVVHSLIILFLLVSCSSTDSSVLQLKYNAFGPQVLAIDLLGHEWPLWESHWDEREHIPIVIVYSGMERKAVELKYPSNPDQGIDYRYVTADAAILHLERTIRQMEEYEDKSVRETLKHTRTLLVNHFAMDRTN